VEGSKFEDLVEIIHAIASKNKELGKSFDDIKAKFEFYEKDNELLWDEINGIKKVLFLDDFEKSPMEITNKNDGGNSDNDKSTF
jgi:hypothetical protein